MPGGQPTEGHADTQLLGQPLGGPSAAEHEAHPHSFCLPAHAAAGISVLRTHHLEGLLHWALINALLWLAFVAQLSGWTPGFPIWWYTACAYTGLVAAQAILSTRPGCACLRGTSTCACLRAASSTCSCCMQPYIRCVSAGKEGGVLRGMGHTPCRRWSQQRGATRALHQTRAACFSCQAVLPHTAPSNQPTNPPTKPSPTPLPSVPAGTA